MTEHSVIWHFISYWIAGHLNVFHLNMLFAWPANIVICFLFHLNVTYFRIFFFFYLLFEVLCHHYTTLITLLINCFKSLFLLLIDIWSQNIHVPKIIILHIIFGNWFLLHKTSKIIICRITRTHQLITITFNWYLRN